MQTLSRLIDALASWLDGLLAPAPQPIPIRTQDRRR